MKKFVVLTDSACDLPNELAERYHIEVLSFTIQVDGKEYAEREDLTPDSYYQLLDEAQGMPSTSQITSYTFLEKFKDYNRQGINEVLYISINSTGSATNGNAQAARAMFYEECPDSQMKIAVVDSHTYSMGYGLFVMRAANKLANGAALTDVVDYLTEQFQKVEVILAVHSLKIIKKSGRISAAAAFAGELVGLRPVISLIQGKTKVEKKVRGDVKILPALLEWFTAHKGSRTPYMIAGTRETDDKNGDAHQLAKLCEKAVGYPPEYIFKLGAAVTSNTGTDAVAIIYLKD